MKKVSIRELPGSTSQSVREAADGSVSLIERRGEPVAELRPLSAPAGLSPARKAKLFASLEKIWKAIPAVGDGTGIVQDDRDR